jgi:biotin carboxyl carrier protein
MKKYKFTIHGNVYDVNIKKIEDNLIDIDVNGSLYKVEVDKAIQTVKTPTLVRSAPIVQSDPDTSFSAKGGTIKSPLPGTVLSILVKVGDTVKVGQKVIVLEAMKMENNLDSEFDGKVISIDVSPGQSVMEGDVMIVIG